MKISLVVAFILVILLVGYLGKLFFDFFPIPFSMTMFLLLCNLYIIREMFPQQTSAVLEEFENKIKERKQKENAEKNKI